MAAVSKGNSSTATNDASSFENEFRKPYFQKLMSTLLNPSMDVEALHKHMEDHADFFRTPTKNGWLPIHYACMAGSFDIVSVLLTAFPESIQLTQNEGLLPLHLSVYGQDPCINTLELLLNKYPQGALHQSNDGKTPLHHAVCGKTTPCYSAVQLLVERCPEAAAVTTAFGKMPLHLCCDTDNPDVKAIQALIRVYPEAARHQDDFPYRRLPLHYLLMRPKGKPCLEAVQALVEANPEAVSHGEQHGKSPLHVSVGTDSTAVNVAVVRCLVTACPSALRSRCASGRLPLMDLVDRDDPSPSALSVLLEATPAVSTRSTLLLTDRSGNTTLHVAVTRARPKIEVIRLLLSACASAASMRNHTDGLPLHDAIQVVEPEAESSLIALLEAYPLAASTPNALGWLPLHLAVHRPRPCLSLLRQLLAVYPDAASHASSQGQFLPLHCAVGRTTPNETVIRLLLEAFPEGVVTKCSLGLSPLGCLLAQQQPSWDVIVPILQEAQENIGKPEKITFPSETGAGFVGSGEWGSHSFSDDDRDKSTCNCVVM